MKSVYIVGGYGTLAGLDICKKMVQKYSDIVQLNDDHDNINFILDSHTFNAGNNETHPVCLVNLQESINRIYNYTLINKIDTTIVGIGCNTMHDCLCKINMKSENVIVVNMVSCVIQYVKSISNIKTRIYLWSTNHTYESGIYTNYLDITNNNVEVKKLLTELYQSIKKNTKTSDIICKSLIDTLPYECILILGCTELPLVKEQFAKYTNNKIIEIVDCNDILATNLVNTYLNI